MQAIKDFVERMFKAKKTTREDQETIDVLIQMLNEKVEDLKEQGLSESDAIDKTIAEFGDADDYYHPHMEREKRRHKRNKTINHYKNDLLFASLSTLLIIAMMTFINIALNYYYDVWVLWFIIPSLGILFWPLSLLYKLLNRRGE